MKHQGLKRKMAQKVLSQCVNLATLRWVTAGVIVMKHGSQKIVTEALLYTGHHITPPYSIVEMKTKELYTEPLISMET